MTVIFTAKTPEAYHNKIIAEILSSNIKTGCFQVDSTGIKLRQIDNNRRVLVDINLRSENFQIYKFKGEKMFLGINMSHFHKMLKTIKKKDSLQLTIDSDSPNDLEIKVIPKENNRTTISYVKIQNIQNIDIDIPENKGNPVLVSSSDFQKMLKDMSGIGTTINVKARNFHISFDCDGKGVMRRTDEFGEHQDASDESGSDDSEEASGYNQNFVTEQLVRISKISGLSSQLKIYPGTPLLFRSNVGQLGEISIYIKSKEQIEEESNYGNDSDDDSD